MFEINVDDTGEVIMVSLCSLYDWILLKVHV